MALFSTLQQRVIEPEVMDDPGLDESSHVHALRGLARLNFVSHTIRLLWSSVVALARRNGSQPLRVLDVATGAGDTPLRLWHLARRKRVPLEITGVDISPRAVQYAQTRAEESGAQVQFQVLDALAEELPRGFDVVTSSLFLHHLQRQEATQLLQKMSAATGQLMVVQDLRRTAFGLTLAYLAARLFTRSNVVHTDATQSVRAAFTIAEVEQLARDAGLDGAQVVTRWPSRFILSWQQSTPSN